MLSQPKVCLLNDSFYPQIDGVANAVLNYAKHIEERAGSAMVVTPAHPQADDSRFFFPVVRYPSLNFAKMEAYRAGIPFSPTVAAKIKERGITVLHSHCPIVSNLLARELRHIVQLPLITTYHTKFDVDIRNVIKNEALREFCIKALVENVSASDEVWAVSRGAGENLRALGFEGDVTVMPNGVDVPRARVSDEKIRAVTAGYDLPEGVPVYLFVGRMMWYKGVRISLDALAKLSTQGKDFRMVLIGKGDDQGDMESYAKKIGIGNQCIFTGAIYDRDALRAWYCRADLFLFPSSYDTNGLVVREAAASSLASVLIRGSCAAEDVTDGKNGFLIEENAESLCACLEGLYGKREQMRTVGACAAEQLYISWSDAVGRAIDRYRVVIDRFARGLYPKRRNKMESILMHNADWMKLFSSKKHGSK